MYFIASVTVFSVHC